MQVRKGRPTSSLIAGVIAGVIYLIISLATGASAGHAVMGAAILLVGVSIISFFIGTLIDRSRATRV